MVPSQNNSYDCGIFMLTFLIHYMMMGGINNFSNLDDNIALNLQQNLQCNSDNIWNLRRYILQLILDNCKMEPKTICMCCYYLLYIC